MLHPLPHTPGCIHANHSRGKAAWVGMFHFRQAVQQPLYLLNAALMGDILRRNEQMERIPNQKPSLKKTFSTPNLVMMAALISMQIVLARFLSIQVSDTLRISFESIPVILAGMWLGPIPGAVVAVLADFLGTIIHGYGMWFPPLALGPMAVGVLSGVSTRYLFRSPLAETKDTWKVVATVVVVGVLNSFCFGLIGSTLYSIMIAGNTTAFPILLGTNFIQRLSTKPLTILVNAVAVTIVNRAVYKPVVSHILPRA